MKEEITWKKGYKKAEVYTWIRKSGKTEDFYLFGWERSEEDFNHVD